MRFLITLFNVLINQKVGHLDKRNSSARERTRKLHQNTQIHAQKKKNLYSNEGTIDYNQQCHPLRLRNKQYKQFPQRKKKESANEKGREKEKEKKGRGKEKERKRE